MQFGDKQGYGPEAPANVRRRRRAGHCLQRRCACASASLPFHDRSAISSRSSASSFLIVLDAGCPDRHRRAVARRLPRRVGSCRFARRAGGLAPARRPWGTEGGRPAAHDRECLIDIPASIRSRFPNVQVKLTEALGPDMSATAGTRRGTFGIRHDQGVDPYFASHPLPPDEFWPLAIHRSTLGPAGMIDIGRLAPIRCCCWIRAIQCACCSTPLAVWQTSNPTFCSRAARRTPCWRSPKPGKG